MMDVSRRDFLKMAAGSGAGFALAGSVTLGMDPAPVAARTRLQKWKLEGTKEVPSVCPYCAVGCGQIVSVRDNQIVNIEGNPDSPISRGHLCPKGAATFQLLVNPARQTKVLYRAPNSDHWETKDLDWAMDRIAERVKKTRDENWTATKEGKKVNHTLALASLGGATNDNEWNYVQAKLARSLGVVWIENQARI
jgi:formate dehydrogenase major subunit